MSSKECLSKFSNNLFWDVDTSQLAMNTHSAFIIQRVLEYGQMIDNTGEIDYGQLYAQVKHEICEQKAPYWFNNDEVARIQQLNQDYMLKKDMTEMVEACFRKPKADESVAEMSTSQMLKIIRSKYTSLVIDHSARVHLGYAMRDLGYDCKEHHHARHYYVVPLSKTA